MNNFIQLFKYNFSALDETISKDRAILVVRSNIAMHRKKWLIAN